MAEEGPKSVKDMTDEELKKEAKGILNRRVPPRPVGRLKNIEWEIKKRDLKDRCERCGKTIGAFNLILSHGLCDECIAENLKKS